jgi:hypothetical protein
MYVITSTLRTETSRISKTWATTNKCTRCNKQKDLCQTGHRNANIKSHKSSKPAVTRWEAQISLTLASELPVAHDRQIIWECYSKNIPKAPRRRPASQTFVHIRADVLMCLTDHLTQILRKIYLCGCCILGHRKRLWNYLIPGLLHFPTSLMKLI